MHVIQIGPNESVAARRLDDGTYQILEDPFVSDLVAKGDIVECVERPDQIPILRSYLERIRLRDDRN